MFSSGVGGGSGVPPPPPFLQEESASNKNKVEGRNKRLIIASDLYKNNTFFQFQETVEDFIARQIDCST